MYVPGDHIAQKVIQIIHIKISASATYDTSFPPMFQRSKTLPSVATTIEAMPSHITKIKTPAILELERRARREAETAVKVIVVRHYLILNPWTSLKTAQFFT